jgi:DNA adenine methylase
MNKSDDTIWGKELPSLESGRTQVVNVSSVRKVSLFRYPGGKTWFVPTARRWLDHLGDIETFVEPFVGGGIVALSMLYEGRAQRIVLNELDEDVSAVWKTSLNEDHEWLAEQILEFSCTRESVAALLATEPVSIKARAFHTIVRNRTNRGGILNKGAGAIKAGENGKGIASRWYPETLVKRLIDIYEHRSGISFHQGDAFPVIERFNDAKRAALFIDPPYTASGKKAGSRLYRHNELDHERLFNLIGQSKTPSLMTYDDDVGIRELASKNHLEVGLVPMQSTHLKKMNELVIGRDLTWL